MRIPALPSFGDLPVRVIPGALLKEYTTFRLGGPCQVLILCSRSKDVVEVVRRLRDQDTAPLMIGLGSNILASDLGVARTIIRYLDQAPVFGRTGLSVSCEASVLWEDLVTYAIAEDLDGLTILSGIPGTVAGAIAGNAGAYGASVSDILEDVTILTKDGRIRTLPREEVGFSYRDSLLKRSGDIILSARFLLKPGKGVEAMMRVRNGIIQSRRRKHGNWKENPSAGSFFRNVLPSSKAGERQAAGWFLEQAGAKTLRVGGAFTLPQHANIITHDGTGSAQDVLEISQKMAKAVKGMFGITLEREVRLLGPFSDGAEGQHAGFW